MATADRGGSQRAKDQMMAAHLKAQGIYHGKRTTAPAWPFDKNQVGSNKYVRYLKSRAEKRIK